MSLAKKPFLFSDPCLIFVLVSVTTECFFGRHITDSRPILSSIGKVDLDECHIHELLEQEACLHRAQPVTIS